MKKTLNLLMVGLIVIFFASCQNSNQATDNQASVSEQPGSPGGLAAVKNENSQQDVVKVAVGSPDHTTLVKALTAAELVDDMSNPGPFTVFAPTNAAFDKLPAGTLDNLLKPESKEQLADILQHHVTLPAIDVALLQDGQSLGMADGKRATIHIKDGATYIDDAKIIASVRASNGIVHVVDAVVLPK